MGVTASHLHYSFENACLNSFYYLVYLFIASICYKKMSKLINPCSYSFNDLIKASQSQINAQTLYAMSQPGRNIEVKNMCKIAGWFWEDVVGSDGILYTAFSPKKS